jgi:hypothetical protein
MYEAVGIDELVSVIGGKYFYLVKRFVEMCTQNTFSYVSLYRHMYV